jgi:hypothetical protein
LDAVISRPAVITSGISSWVTATPRLPPAALMPSAAPFLLSGKKNEMLAIDDEKFPPPNPASAARTMNTHIGVAGWLNANARPTQGIASIAALNVVKPRPPNFGMAKV